MLGIAARAGRRQVARFAQRTVRYAHSNSFLFTLANKSGLKDAEKYALTVGPSVEALRIRLNLPSLYRTDPKIIEFCEDPAVIWDLATPGRQINYIDYPLEIKESVDKKNGFVAFNLSEGDSGKKLLGIRRLIDYLATQEIHPAKLTTEDLYLDYLVHRKIKQSELEKIAESRTKKAREIDEKSDAGAEFLKQFEKRRKSKAPYLSFTDIEVAYFMDVMEESGLRNVSLIAPNGRLVTSRYFRTEFQRLLTLKRSKASEFESEMTAFESKMENPGKDNNFLPCDTALECFSSLPLLQKINNECSAHIVRNINSFCFNVLSNLLNNTVPGDAVLAVLQFPGVYGETPHFATLLFTRNGSSVQVEELFISKDDPQSLLHKMPSEKLFEAVSTVATPSADICIIKDVDYLRKKTADISIKMTEADRSAMRILHTLYEVFGDPSVKVHGRDGQPVLFSCSGNKLADRLRIMHDSGFLHTRVKNGSRFVSYDEQLLTHEMMDLYDRDWNSLPFGHSVMSPDLQEEPKLPPHISIQAVSNYEQPDESELAGF